MGLLVGMVFYPIISPTKRHKAISWAFRLAALPLVIVLFVVLIRNFYTSDPYAGKFVYYPLSSSILTDGSKSLQMVSLFVMHSNKRKWPLPRVSLLSSNYRQQLTGLQNWHHDNNDHDQYPYALVNLFFGFTNSPINRTFPIKMFCQDTSLLSVTPVKDALFTPD